jgi:hypothetical protein
MTVNHDTDGTPWMTVRYTIEVQVMADNEQDALYFADLALPDIDVKSFAGSGEVVK